MEAWLATWAGLVWSDFQATAYALLGVAILTALEWWFPAQPGQGWIGRGRNLLYLVIYKVLGLGAIALWFAYGPTYDIVARYPSALESALLVAANLVANDFLYYWYHRAQHRFPLLWAIHELHHADEELNSTSSYRTYWLEAPVQTILVLTPTFLFFGAFGTTHSLIVHGCSLFFLVFSHANIRFPLGVLGFWVIGPQVHRIHHSRLPAHRDQNFAQFFPFLDRLFGSFYAPARDEYPPTGTEGLASDASIGSVMIKPLRIWAAGATAR